MAAGFYAKVTCSPPLGQLTVFSPEVEEVHFTVAIEWGKHGGPDLAWEAVLEHRASAAEGYHTASWNTLPLQRSKLDLITINQSKEAGEQTYNAQLQGSLPVEAFQSATRADCHECFALRYRSSPYANWHHTSHESGLQEGELLIQRPIPADLSIDSYLYIGGKWSPRNLGSVDTSPVFSLESKSPVKAHGEDNKPHVEVLPLGKITKFTRWFSIGRYQEMWLGPRQGKQNFRLTDPALTVSFLTEVGHHFTLLALNGAEDIQTHFVSEDCGGLAVSIKNDNGKDTYCRVLAAVSLDLEASISAVMEAGRKLISGSPEAQSTLAEIQSSLKGDSRTLSEIKPLDDWYDGLAFCTYNSLGLNLSTERILGALESLASQGVYPPTLIIDDNWQTITGGGSTGRGHDYQAMQRFEANSEYFPEGLKAAISKIRFNNPHLEDVAVWHALMGYWGGIAPDSELARDYKTVEADMLLVGHKSGVITAIDPQDVSRWYNDFYAYLSDCGITGVKTDVQCHLDMFTEAKTRSTFSSLYQNAWMGAHLRHFGGRAISCMSMIPQILFHQFQLPGMPKVMLRNSDDFYPEYPESHLLHVFVNAHNTLFTKNLNVLPDWDMFQTKQAFGWYHGAARALSGGPIYVTDSPGEHDIDLIHEMTGLSPSGRTVALRPDIVGRATWAYESLAEGKVLKIATAHGKNAMLGLFNTTMTDVTHMLPLSAIPTTSSHENVIVMSHTSGKIYGPFNGSTLGPEQQIYLTLPVRGYEILTMYPLETVSGVSIAVQGLLGKMAGPAAVKSSTITQEKSTVRIAISLKVLGVLGVWLKSSRQWNVDVKIEGKSVVSRIDVGNSEGEELVKIDVLEAWRNLGLNKAGNSETNVEISLS